MSKLITKILNNNLSVIVQRTLYACFLVQNVYSDFDEYCKVVKEQIEKNNKKS